MVCQVHQLAVEPGSVVTPPVIVTMVATAATAATAVTAVIARLSERLNICVPLSFFLHGHSGNDVLFRGNFGSIAWLRKRGPLALCFMTLSN